VLTCAHSFFLVARPRPAPYPVQLLDHITAEFKKIKAKQAELLGMGSQGSLAGGGKGAEDNRLEPEPPRPPRARL
jgi:hypothetical protein